MLFSHNGSEMLSQVSGKLHFDGTTSGNDGVGLDGSSDNHDSVVKRSVGLFNILGSSSSDNNGASFVSSALSEHVESLRSELDLLELSALTKGLFWDSVGGSLENSSASLSYSRQILEVDSSSAEDVSVGEILGS